MVYTGFAESLQHKKFHNWKNSVSGFSYSYSTYSVVETTISLQSALNVSQNPAHNNRLQSSVSVMSVCQPYIYPASLGCTHWLFKPHNVHVYTP